MKKLKLTIWITFLGFLAFGQEYENISEDFNDNSNEWAVIDIPEYTSRIADGCFTMNNKSDVVRISALELPIDPYADYSLETQITHLKSSQKYDKKSFYGFYWGSGGVDNYLYFLVSEKGEIWLLYREFNVQKTQVKRIFKGYIIPNAPNILKVEKTSDAIRYYVNGKIVYTGNVFKHDGTVFTFYVPVRQSLKVDYLKIQSKKRVINLVENPINGYKLENPGNTYFRACSTIIGSQCLTTVCGMGTGVSTAIWSPGSDAGGGKTGPRPGCL